MENNNFNMDTEIKRITEEVLAGNEITKIIRENVQNAIGESIKRSFNYGELGKAINARIESVMVPYIEKYDFKEYLPKLDTILTEVVNATPISDAKTVLENFRSLMTPPEKDVMTMDEIFQAYCKYMASVAETSGRTVTYDSGSPEYESFECSMYYEDYSSEESLFERIEYTFKADIDTEYNERSEFVVTLSRYKHDKDKNYIIGCENEPTITGLKHLDDFEILLIRLARAGVKIDADSIKDMTEEVVPEKEPEPTYE